MRVLIATEKPFAPNAAESIENEIHQAGFEVAFLVGYTQKQELIDAACCSDAMIVRSDIVDAEVIEKASNLKIIVRAGAGYDNIDIEAATKAGKVVMNTPGQNANAVAELAVGLLLYHESHHLGYVPLSPRKGRILGIHGFGNVGKNIARIAKGLGMFVSAYSVPSISIEERHEYGVQVFDTLDDLYSTAQYISINVPLLSCTKGCVNMSLLRRLPLNAVLINTARQEIINEDDLMKIMDERSDISYLSDIKPKRYPEFIERFSDRILCTPQKMGAQTEEANANAGIAAAKQIISFFKEGDVTFQVNV